MKRLIVPTLVAGIALLSGCIPCLHAIYTDKDLIFDSALLGVWDDAHDTRWEFTKIDATTYRLIMVEKERQGIFDARLVKLDGVLFLDMFPVEPDWPKKTNSDFYQNLWVPVHTFFVVDSITPKLRIRWMNDEWLKNYVKAHPDALQCDVSYRGTTDNRLLVTASTKELQAFLLKHRNEEGAYSETRELSLKERR